MRVFAIKDESLTTNKVLGYLIYYENAKAFYIELPDDADPWETPLILSSFIKHGEHSINSYWSRIWVEQRIIPQERQNIGQVLRDNGLSEYDPFTLLMLSMGRCEQDQYYLEELHTDSLPEMLYARWTYKLEDVVPLDHNRLLVFFRSGGVKIVDVGAIDNRPDACKPFLRRPQRFHQVSVQPDGYGVWWNEQAAIADRVLFEHGMDVPLSLEDFCRFVQLRVINATEACRILDCSRQNIDDLMRRGKLHPIRTDDKYKLFLKNEVEQRRKS